MWTNEFVERIVLNLILTMPCCGKSYIHSLGTKYFDLDIFTNLKTVSQKKVAKKMLKSFAQNCNESNIYLFNISSYRALMLFQSEDIEVQEIIIPKDFDFRYKTFCNRDLELFGVVRTKSLELFKRKWTLDINFAYELSEQNGIKLTFLKEGEFLSDYLLSK